jgi:hypothetical protein
MASEAQLFLGVFAKFRKATIISAMSICLSVRMKQLCLSVRMKQLVSHGRIFMKFEIG